MKPGILNDDSPFITVALLDRVTLSKHPWSLGGAKHCR